MTTISNKQELLLDYKEEQVKKEEVKEETEMKDNPALGVFWYCTSFFFFSLNFVFAKCVYTYQPELTSNQLLFYRSVISTIFSVLTVNVNLKHVCWDSITSDQIIPLAMRVI